MVEHLGTLRQAGFFKEYEALSNHELVDALRKRKHGDFSRLTELLSQDDKKFLDIDLEADVLDGNNVYVSVLEEFSNASNGHFKPTAITEVWESEEGPAQVSFLSNGQQIVFEPEYMDDWIDGRIFEVINQEMNKASDESFMLCSGPNDEWFGQNVIYIRLTKAEMQLLKEVLGWNFY